MKKISYIAIIFLLFAILPFPNSYYLLLRLVIFFISGVFSIRLLEAKDFDHAVLFLGVVILFNPFFPVYLDKSIWIILDLITAYIFLQSNKLILKKISGDQLLVYFFVMLFIYYVLSGVKEIIYPPCSDLSGSERIECEINEERELYFSER